MLVLACGSLTSQSRDFERSSNGHGRVEIWMARLNWCLDG